LPLGDASQDAAVCIESLEHVLRPEWAVAEICRVVRPGGRVLVIDKDRRFQGLSICEPWERWFEPGSVASWLAAHCNDVTCTPLPPGPHQRTDGLFLCWQGVRRAETAAIAIRRAA
jgi:malonyl-CoA O-methyltransferase